MSNVSQKVHRLNTFKKEGTGTIALVFLLCVLFLLFQFYSLFSPSQESGTLDVYLNVLSEQTLSVVSLDSNNGILHSNKSAPLDSKTNYRLSPFFFQPIPVNYSDKSLLMSIRGIGPNLAQRIIQARDSNGNFTAPEELLEIKGIGPAKLSKIKPYLSFSK